MNWRRVTKVMSHMMGKWRHFSFMFSCFLSENHRFWDVKKGENPSTSTLKLLFMILTALFHLVNCSPCILCHIAWVLSYYHCMTVFYNYMLLLTFAQVLRPVEQMRWIKQWLRPWSYCSCMHKTARCPSAGFTCLATRFSLKSRQWELRVGCIRIAVTLRNGKSQDWHW